MPSKKCFKCNILKPLEDFYKHSGMKDGRLGKCKECNKSDVIKNRLENVDRYREYDRKRGNRNTAQNVIDYRIRYPNKYKAKNMVNNYIRAKKLFREPCENCGTSLNVHGHHDDYDKPLNVRWLCAAHHSQWHKKHGQGMNHG
tara:strand:- start:35 stop:463 length:429 start_codon:yes stop_codon:yes gene_type:complete